MAIAPETPRLVAALEEVSQRSGLSTAGASLIHHYSNAVYHLPAENAVARITIGAYRHEAAMRAQQFTRWLVTEHGFPATAPLPDIPAVEIDAETVVTFWSYYPQSPSDPQPRARDLGGLLRALHEFERGPFQLPDWAPLTSLETALTNGQGQDGPIDEADRLWLLEQIGDVRQELTEAPPPSLGVGVIHGDAWLGNLMFSRRDSSGVVLGDWDGLAIGPREVDLIPTWHAVARYGKDLSTVQDFISEYGFDLSEDAMYPALLRLRDLMQLTGPLRRAAPGNVFAHVLEERLEGIRHPARSRVWTAL